MEFWAVQFWRVFAIGGAILGVVCLSGWPLLRDRFRRKFVLQARDRFHLRREWLEARFLTLAEQSGKPRGLRWANCEFDDGVAFARERSTRRLRALVGVTIQFEAVVGGGMEEVEAVSNLRAATAIFRLDGSDWETDGRAYFNLSPTQTIEHYRQELETVDDL
jgi:hypothetical protein